jgi:hypothetical protein
MNPSNGCDSFADPWMAVTPPTAALVSTYFNTDLPSA